MNKIRKIILDFDNTMVDTVKAAQETYNILYSSHPDFKPIQLTTTTVPYMVSKWLPLLNEWAPELFDSDIFFEKVKPFPNAVEVLKKLVEKYGYEIIGCSYGSYKNIIKKCDYIPRVFPFIKKFIPVIGIHSKSMINMRDAYFIDDFPQYLISSDAYDVGRAYRFSYYTYTDYNWDGPVIPNYEYMEKLFTKLLLEKD